MNNFKTSFGLTLIIVFGLSILSITPLSSANISSYSNVQINIQTASIQSGYFTVSAYNMTGFQESSVQTYYPAASFELPNGQYIFTVTVDNQTNLISPVPLVSTPASSSGSTTGTTSLPMIVAPTVEYGYSVQQISSAVTITINTQNVASFPTNTLTIQVLYDNGTAASDASISASTIGSSYYWGYEPNVVTWTTTNSQGYATLVTPIAPEQIYAWSWLPLNLTGVAVPPLPIAGQPVNVTATIQPPSYEGVSGSTIIIPPQTTASITMYTQQQDYWVTPSAPATPQTGSASAPSASSSVGPGAIPASVYAQQQGNPALQAFQTSSTPTPAPTAAVSATISSNTLLLAILVVVVIAVVAVTSLMIAARTKRKNNNRALQQIAISNYLNF